MNKLFYDVGYVTLNKNGEELCGDKVEYIRNEHGLTVVLADGLGSGVKANILATLTSSMLCNMIANGLDITDAVETVVRTLPVCKVRKVAYSTFSIIYIDNNGNCRLIECDNPQAWVLRDGKNMPIERQELIIENKSIFISSFDMQEGDSVAISSDGVIHAGVGTVLNFGWERGDVLKYFESRYNAKRSARCLSSIIANACYDLYMGSCGDDTTVAAVKAMRYQKVNIMVGPPANKELDLPVVTQFMESHGYHVVCGGTTSQIVARVLGKEINTDLSTFTEEIPPIGLIEGLDLVTEGVLTVRKLIQMSDRYLDVKDCNIKEFKEHNGASMLGELLFEQATEVEVYIGRGVNMAHQDLDIHHGMKVHLVEELVKRLRKLGKQVEVKYY